MGYLVCAPTGFFADDVSTRCATCDASIVHRPHAPPGLVKICMSCAAMLTGDIEVRVTEETRREMALYGAKTKGGVQ